MPPWMKVPIQGNERFQRLKVLIGEQRLHTVCQSANCPNVPTCWSRGAVTFMILGEICTRSCGFCDVTTGRPGPIDGSEPERLARSLASLGLSYAVITSVDRDDLPDSGAGFWSEVIRRIRDHCPDLGIEALTPDFGGQVDHIRTVVEAGPEVFAHNLETVARLQPEVRPQAGYRRSLAVLSAARDLGAVTKSGLMVGLGETDEEVMEALEDLRGAGCELVSIGQYLRPSLRHLPVRRWVSIEQFAGYERSARALGFSGAMCGPLVRSSYRAEELAASRSGRCGGMIAQAGLELEPADRSQTARNFGEQAPAGQGTPSTVGGTMTTFSGRPRRQDGS